jgi:hypothetical protein
VFLQTYGAVALIVLIAVVLGRAICTGGGRDSRRWYAESAVGLAFLIVLEGATIKLPGRAVTAIVFGALALVVASVLLLRHRRLARVRWGDVVAGSLALLGASIPFVANGRIGLQGVSVDNDTSSHLLWAESLRSPAMDKLWHPSAGYPVGPHSVVASIGTLTASPLDMTFAGLLIAVVVITALVGAGILGEAPGWRRALTGTLCSLAFLVAGYYAEGAFKETIMALLLLAFVVHLEQVSARWSGASAIARFRFVVPVVLLPAGAIYTYSYTGLAWFGLTIVIWLVVSLIRRPSAVRAFFSQHRWRGEAGWAAGAVALTVIVVLPVISQVISFFNSYGFSAAGSGLITTTNLGNLSGRLSPYEAFGVWMSPDFRTNPINVFHTGQLSALALLVAAYGAVWALRNGKLLMLSAVAACVLIWWRTDRTQSPYVAAKALVIGTPLIMALSLRGLLVPREGPLITGALRLGAAGVFCAFAAYSSYQLLRHQPVEAHEPVAELAAFHKQIEGSPVLFLGTDEYAVWELRPAAVTALFPASPSVGAATARPNKPFVTGDQLDFDSVNQSDLDRFRWVVTSSSPYSSQAPPNFRLVSSRQMYDLWERVGPTNPRRVIEPPSAPAAVASCKAAPGSELRAEHGMASIIFPPVTAPGPNFLSAGASATVQLPLPAGEWEISLQYLSTFNFAVSAQGRRWTMPAYVGRQGPFFVVGDVTGQGIASPVPVTFTADHPSALTGALGNLFTYLPSIAATRVPDSRQILPLSRVCGRDVDWYR